MLEIKWTDEAENKFLEVLEYWNLRNKSNTYSLKIIQQVKEKESLISQNPFIGQIVDGTERKVRRLILLSNFSIFYRIHGSHLEIVSFWCNKMNPLSNDFATERE